MEYCSNIIRGGTSELELLWLFNAAKEMKSILEIGSFLGRSTHALLSGINPEYYVYSIDPFDSNIYKTQNDPEYSLIYEKFIENTKSFKNLKVIRKQSRDALQELKDLKFDMIFIDGNHEYSEVKNDINWWMPKAVKLLCGHDYNKYYENDVIKAVDELVGKVEVYESIWIKRI
jgi:predicted O-methyltransferase YrrM